MDRFARLNRLAETGEALRQRAIERLRTANGQNQTQAHAESAQGATEVITSRPAPGVLKLHLAGGSRRNVLGRSTIARIESLVEFAPVETRVILLTADAPDFCAGYDLLEASRDGAEHLIAHESNLAILRRSTRPIVVALRGNVIGGGLELALAADVRIAARDTRFSIPASALGVVYSEPGVNLLVDELGESIARAMLLAGRVISAKEALGSGLVMEVVAPEELDARALALATKIASWSPVATTGNRRVLDVVTGRVHDDTAALRLTSFEPEGALLANIERFVTRRTSAPRTRTLLFPTTPSKSWHVIRSWATRVVNRGIGRLATISNMRSTTSH